MLCPECGRYNEDDKIVCQYCGKLLEKELPDTGEEELMRFRQGRHLKGQTPPVKEPPRQRRSGASRAFEDPQPPVTPESTGAIYGQRESLSATGRFYGEGPDDYIRFSPEEQPDGQGRPSSVQQSLQPRQSRVERHLLQRRMVNWAWVIIVSVVLLIAGVLGFLLFLRTTHSGQVLLARWGYDASAEAMWQVGVECDDRGEVERAIGYYTAARALDVETKTYNVSGLLKLGEAYEARGDLAAAEEVYAFIYLEAEPTNADAYRAQVRVLREQGRDAEAARLLETAYQQTQLPNFRTDRLDILPDPPSYNVPGGYYIRAQTISFSQDQEYDIYYSTNPFAVLPEEGVLYEEPLVLGEGEHEIRAVSVNGDLVSDPIKVSYSIYMPTPLQPDANLAPGTYNSARTNVRLWPGSLSDEQLEKNPGYADTLDDPIAQTITIYYTIDGSIPDSDSPIYTGEPIVMNTNGYMYLRAISVNGYDKAGNMKEIEIKLNLKTKSPKVYNMEDTVAGLKLATTSLEVFQKSYGASTSTETVYLASVDGECTRHLYPWGYATFMKQSAGWLLVEVYTTTNELAGPRGTAIGMSETDITSKFKDFGQVESASGNRGLYHDIDNSDKGKIYVQEDGGKIIRYRTDTTDMHIWQLDYVLDASGKVVAMHWLYER